YTGFISALFTIIYAGYAVHKGDWAISFKATIFVLAFAVFFLSLSVYYIIKKYEALTKEYHQAGFIVDSLRETILNLEQNLNESHEAQANIAVITHNVFHEHRKLINNIYADSSSQECENYETRVLSFHQFILYFVNNVKQLFDTLTRGRCSVCLKLITTDPKNDTGGLVRTFMRDSISYRERSNTDMRIPEFHVHENTAFKRILDNECPDSYYICNNLKEERGYINLNQDWQKYYNACLVVPIRILKSKMNGTKTQHIVIGFLCVDNLHGGFDDRIGLNILAAFGDSLFHLFVAFNDLKTKCDVARKVNS
ncbi:MAG: hypothetical protein ACLPYB_13980, partial [Desulfobaccales bacterium]